MLNIKGRSGGFIEKFEVGDVEFHRPGLKPGVFHAFGPGPDFTGDGDHILTAKVVGFLVEISRRFGVKNHLGQAPPVPEVDEGHPSVVPVVFHPAA